MSKIALTDTALEAVVKMAEGNPGAVSAIMDIREKHHSIDPQSALGWLGVLMTFDDMEIYGSDIYVLWSDKCNRDTRKLIMLMRAMQLGFISHARIKEMSKDQMRKINLTSEEFQELDDKVCGKLNKFQK